MKTVYLYILEGNKYLFAEEQYRKLFLDHLYELKCSDTWLLGAFCLIDPCAMFVIEEENMTPASGDDQAGGRAAAGQA